MTGLMLQGPGGRSRRARRRPGRRAGLALLAWGVAGLVLAVGSLVAVAGPLASLEGLAGQRATAVRWLELADRNLADAAASTRGAATSLTTARTSTESAAGLFRDLSGALSALSAASAISIFGTQPFGAAAADLDRVAGRSTQLASEMGDLGRSLDGETAGLARLADDVEQLRTELAGLRSLATDDAGARVADAARGLGLFAVLVALWLALPSLAAIALGTDLVRRGRGVPPRATATTRLTHPSPAPGDRP